MKIREPVASQAPAGKSYELWIIAPKQAPKSLGVMRNAVFGVTVEPKGGSPVSHGKLAPVGP